MNGEIIGCHRGRAHEHSLETSDSGAKTIPGPDIAQTESKIRLSMIKIQVARVNTGASDSQT